MAIPRVVGIETEYGIARRSMRTKELRHHQRPVEDSTMVVSSTRSRVGWDYATETELPALTNGRTVEDVCNAVLPNGARLYEDHGHPEYATPECISPLQVVTYDRAGERIVDSAREAANRELLASGMAFGDEIVIYKNNADVAGHSFGCHENYLMERRTGWGRLREALLPFLVTRQVFTGAGKVGIHDPDSEDRTPTAKQPVIGGKTGSELVRANRSTGDETAQLLGGNNGGAGEPVALFGDQAVFQLSQRPDFFRTEEGLQTTSHRPLLNTRDEPHADPDRYRRLHVIVGDANLAPWSTFLKIGTTWLVLDMIEDGVLEADVALRDPVLAFRSISQDPEWAWQITFGDGRTGTAVDHQEMYLDCAKRHYSADPVKAEIIERWESVLDALRRQDVDALADKLDHVIKWRLIERQMERHGWDLRSPQVQKLDLRYHSVNRAESIYSLLERRGYVDTLGVTEEAVQQATHTPPTETRAYFRGKCISRFPRNVMAANWDLLDIEGVDEGPVQVPMNDPFKGTEALTKDFFASSKTMQDLLDIL